jgi:hypothetical protein
MEWAAVFRVDGEVHRPPATGERRFTAVSDPVRHPCAVDHRATEEGLEQEFNTLDAQHDATAAFIRSQRGEGWGARHGHYDDGGFADATTERPALEKLLLDVRDAWSTG